MRTDENSLNLEPQQRNALFLERMRFFYELFPYPNRPFFIKPDPAGSIEAHAGFATLLANPSENLDAEALADLKLRDVRHAFAKDKHIALVGCGTDEPLLFRCLHPHNPITAIDISHTSLLRAERKIRFHQMKPVTLLHGDAEAILSQEEQLFSHIQCFGVLHHQPKPKKLLKVMADSLVPGGTLRLMIYSSNGRKLERGVQKKFNKIWEKVHPPAAQPLPEKPSSGLPLLWASFRLLFWRMLLPLTFSRSKVGRFRYIGLSRARVADAFLHPSDHPLSLRDTISWAGKYGLKLIAHRAKSYELGELGIYAHPQTTLQTLVGEEERGNISTNIVLFFKKVENG